MRIIDPRVGLLALSTVLFAACFGDSSTDPQFDGAEMSILQGNGQFAPAGQLLPERLEVAVRSIDDQGPVEDAILLWEVIEGSGATLADAQTLTDSAGVASNTLRLGSELGTYRVRVSLRNADGVLAEFEAFAVLPPTLESAPAQAVAGEVIELRGENFSRTPSHNVVLFSGIRGRVEASAEDRLRVEVPSCLPRRGVDVSVRFGEVTSNALEMAVSPSGSGLALEIGQDTLLTETDGGACVRIPGSLNQAAYMIVVQSAGRVAGARYAIGLRGRAGSVLGAEATGTGAAGVSEPARTEQPPWMDPAIDVPSDPQGRWDRFLREREQLLLSEYTWAAVPQPRAPARAAPSVGDTDDFKVIGEGNEFEDVTARLRVIGDRALFYLDERAAGLISDTALQQFSDQFDAPIAPAVTEAYGEPSDLDDNGKVVVLLTPVVNQLTERGEDGFVAGFFFGLDLLQGAENSNGGEIFYLVVPDPTGIYSDPRTLQSLRGSLPPVLAHELQHMVHFNQRVLIRSGGGTDALWLSEGLATMAEDLVGLAAGRSRALYQLGNYLRAGRYLADPTAVSLIVSSGSGSLAERGAGWLFVRYLWENFGGTPALGALTQTTVTGIDNVEGVTGESWSRLFSDWGAAVESEFQGWGTLLDERHRYPTLNLATALDGVNVARPPPATTVGNFDFDEGVELWSGGTRIFILQVASSRDLALNLGALTGGPLPSESRGQVQVIRVQ